MTFFDGTSDLFGRWLKGKTFPRDGGRDGGEEFEGLCGV
jgi:hypothetical protein